MSLIIWLAAAAIAAEPAEIYANTCAACHGDAGKGDGPAAASLPVKPANFSDPAFWSARDDAAVKKAITEGGAAVGKSPIMAPYGSIYSADEVDSIVAYLKTMKP